MKHSSAARARLTLLRLDASDNVAVACRAIEAGESIECDDISLVAQQDVMVGFKVALTDIPVGAKLIKHGGVIGSATSRIAAGELVHLHNLGSDYLQTVTLSGSAGTRS